MNIQHNINLYRRYPHWKTAGCIYIHIPKAAGTSINSAIYGRTLGHYRAHEISSRFPKLYQNCFTFSFVRNPWSRVLSAYQFAKTGGTDAMGMSNPEKYQVPEFETFERFLFDWLSSRNLENEDFVFQPQCNYVLNENMKVMVDFIGKVENFEHDIKIVEKTLSRDILLKHINRTSKTFDFRKSYTNPAMVDLVSRLYAEDINLFNYDF